MKKLFICLSALGMILMGCSKNDKDNDNTNIEDIAKDICKNLVDYNFATYCIANFDDNNDGAISPNEAQNVTKIDCRNKNISSLEGLEYFPNLQELICSYNLLTELDCSQNSHLNKIDCSNNKLTTLDLSKNTECVNISAYECPKLRKVLLNENLNSIEKLSLSNCINLSVINIPQGINKIGDFSFAGCINLESVNIPECCTFIPYGAFRNCISLKTITLPQNVTIIETSAFEECTNLQNIQMFGGISEIGDRAFFKCIKLENLVIPNGIKEIGESAFEECNSIESIQIPNSVTAIGQSAFAYCRNLISIEIGTGLGRISPQMCYNCEKLSTITFLPRDVPKNRIEIGNRAFYNCYSLTSLYTPYIVTTIRSSAFARSGLKTVTIVGYTEDFAFAYCPNLESVKISYADIGRDAFRECRKLSSVTIEGCQTIGSNAFCQCESLTSITLPSVDKIESGAFSGCINLITVDLGYSLSYIGSIAFYGCDNLTVYCRAKQPPYCPYTPNRNIFSNKCTIYVPSSSVDDYKKSSTSYFWQYGAQIKGYDF